MCWSRLSNYARKIEGCIADENDSDLRYSVVPLKGKNKTLVKILGGRQHRTIPAGQILGGVATPATPAANILGPRSIVLDVDYLFIYLLLGLCIT